MALARPTELNHLFQDVRITDPQPGDLLTRGATHWENQPAASGGMVLVDDATPQHYWRLTVNSSGALLTEDLGTSLP